MYSKSQQLGKIKINKKTGKLEISELALTEQCENWLKLNNIPFIRIPDMIYKIIFGNQSILIWQKKFISEFIKGLPDFTVLLPNGVYICIELKTSTGKQTAKQKGFEKSVKNYEIVRSFEDFIKTINNYV